MLGSSLQAFRASDGTALWTENASLLFVDRGVAYLLNRPSSGNMMLIAHRDHASNMLWQRSLGTGNVNAGCQFPINGILYCIGADAHVIYAFNTANGNLLWKHGFEGTASLQTVANGIAYVTTFITLNGHNGIGSHALDASSGKLLWSIWHYAP